MKRTAMQHTKLKRLVRALKVPQYAAVGILESLWHLTAREAPEGNIGKLSNEDIAAWIDWDGTADVLIEGLVTAGWLDEVTEYRLVVHDWHEHADDATKKAIDRQRKKAADNGGNVQTKPDKTRLPEPEPEPEPCQSHEVSKATPSHPGASLGAVQTLHPDMAIYEKYPRKEGKGAAMEAIRKAVARLMKGEAPHPPMAKIEAQRFLMRRVLEYERSPVGRQADKTKIPHPATWFNQKRYDDDQTNWHRTENGNGFIHSKTGRNVDAGEAALAILKKAERDFGSPDEVQPEAGSGGEPGDLSHLRAGSIELRD